MAGIPQGIISRCGGRFRVTSQYAILLSSLPASRYGHAASPVICVEVRGMPRVDNGKRWIQRMRSCSAEKLLERADSLQARIERPTNTDDPLWAQRGIENLRRAAARREKASLVKRRARAKQRQG